MTSTADKQASFKNNPLRRQRQQATRRFTIRVVLLLLVMGSVAYIAWFAPWARPIKAVRIEAAR